MSSAENFATYDGNCHCGAVRYTLKLSPPLSEGYEVVNCSCSICTKNGYSLRHHSTQLFLGIWSADSSQLRYLLVYPLRSDVTFTQGKETLKQYSFGSKKAPHSFCNECGSSVMITPGLLPSLRDKYAMNVSFQVKDSSSNLARMD